MRKGNIALAVIFTLAAIIATAVVAVPGLANGQEVCAEGGEWSSHQDPPLAEVDGAVEYCVKGGSDNSHGCEGYLYYGSFDEVESVVNDEESCGLSHWTFRIEEQEATDVPDPTPTEVFSPTPTEIGPEPTPTPTEEPEPTIEPSPTDIESTPTDPPAIEPTPEELPSAGLTFQVGTMTGTPWIVIQNGDTTVWAAHNQEGWPAGEWWRLWVGQEFYWEYGDTPGRYVVTGYFIVQPEEVELIYSTEPAIILVTCRSFDTVENVWRERLVIYAELEELP